MTGRAVNNIITCQRPNPGYVYIPLIDLFCRLKSCFQLPKVAVLTTSTSIRGVATTAAVEEAVITTASTKAATTGAVTTEILVEETETPAGTVISISNRGMSLNLKNLTLV